MSYRSITKILGESSLERKIRILFGTSLLFLFCGAFWYDSNNTDTFILKSTRRKAQQLASLYLLRAHGVQIDPETQKVPDIGDLSLNNRIENNTDSAAMGPPLLDGIRPIDNAAVLMVVDNKYIRNFTSPDVAGLSERNFLGKLEKSLTQYQDRLDELAFDINVRPEDAEAEFKDIYTKLRQSDSQFGRFGEYENYIYYEPVFFGRQCTTACHTVNSPDSRTAKAPIYFLKVSLPYSDANPTNLSTPSILMLVAIVGSLFTAIAIFIIVRYGTGKRLKRVDDVKKS